MPEEKGNVAKYNSTLVIRMQRRKLYKKSEGNNTKLQKQKKRDASNAVGQHDQRLADTGNNKEKNLPTAGALQQRRYRIKTKEEKKWILLLWRHLPKGWLRS